MTLPVDTMLENRYRIDRLLASGGMGAIYKAFDTNLKTAVAIKENFFQTPEAIQQFEQEALILARLRHPGLPRVIQHFSSEGQQYLVMDYIEGKDLWEIVKDQDIPLDEKLAIEYIIQICDAVHYLHRQNPAIIHRDIKPQNIKITPDTQAVLVDFGIAKVGGEDTKTRTGARGVTPGFSPPEQYSGLGTTPVSDVYALGATLYAVLTGKKPPDSISLLVGGATFESPDLINPKLSREVGEAVKHAMETQQSQRPNSADAWKKELQTCLDTLNAQRKKDEEETLAGATPPAVEETAAGLKAPVAKPAAAGAAFWLVDRSGTGYPIGPNPLVIGRHSQADVPIQVLSASREHAFVRAEGGQCYVRDNDSANGTFVNDQAIGNAWHPINPGDVLAVGTMRFNISTTQPAHVAEVNPKPRTFETSNDKIETVKPVPSPVTPPPAISAAPPVSAPAAKSTAASMPRPGAAVTPAASGKSGLPLIPIIMAGIIVLAAIGVAAFFIMSADGGTSPTPTVTLAAKEDTQPVEAAANTQNEIEMTSTAEAEMTESTRQAEETAAAEAIAESTRQAEETTEANTPTAAAESAAAPTATEESAPTETPAPTEEASISATETPTTAASSPTPTQTRAAATATPQAAAAAPRASGPTAIPVNTVESVAEIGSAPVTAVEINPANPNEVYALVKGGVNSIFKSSTGGGGPWGKLDIDASGITDFVVDPTNPARLFAPAWNAVIRSDDGGNSWKAFGDGLSTANRVVDIVTIDAASPNILYAGIGDTLVVSTDGGASWVSEGFGNGLGQGRLTSIVVDPFNHDVVFVAGEFGSIYKSVDSGRNFQQLAYNTGRGAYGMAANPEKRDEFLAGINSFEAGVIKTTNAADFTSISNGLIFGGADSAYSAITYAPGNPNIVYVGSGYEADGNAKGIFKSADAGKSWTQINNGLRINPTTGQPHYVRDIAVHPTNPDIVFAATGWGLYKSSDGGANWALQ